MTDRRDVDRDEERAARWEQIHGTDPRDETPCGCDKPAPERTGIACWPPLTEEPQCNECGMDAPHAHALAAAMLRAKRTPSGLDEFAPDTTHNPEAT